MQQHAVASDGRTYVIVSAARPAAAATAVERAPTPPDLCVLSPSPEARRTADLAFAGRHVRMMDEPLLERQHTGESFGDYAWRCADALRTLYALETRSAFVIFDAFVEPDGDALVLDEASLLRVAERIERWVPAP
jgi:hypothetical protein